MAMATRQAPAVTRLSASCYIRCLLFFIITVVAVSTPARAASSPPSSLVLYGFQDDSTGVEIASPSGNLSANEFGTTFVIRIPLREMQAVDSPAVGAVTGLLAQEQDFSFYSSVTYVINTANFNGTISGQGLLNSNGEGEHAITGGTFDFRFARGYVNVTALPSDSFDYNLIKFAFTVKYD